MTSQNLIVLIILSRWSLWLHLVETNSPADNQRVEVICQSVSTHSVAQVQQRWEVAPVLGEGHFYRTTGHLLLSWVWDQLPQTHPGNVTDPLVKANPLRFIWLWINEKKCPFRCPLHPEPNVKLEKGSPLAKHLYCQAKKKCWWVFVFTVLIQVEFALALTDSPS